VKVAVLDTGVNMRHPDFVGRFDEGVNAVSFVNGQGVQDGHGHGTHTTGTVAGPSRSVGGIRYGVAPDADIFSGKVLSNRGSGSDDTIIEGIDWARDQGCKVISMSLGSAREPGEPFSAAYESLAQQLLDDGVLIVAAAGNESDRPDILAPVGNPAACPSILAVAAIDRRLGIADFSCRKVDPIGEVNISGPGVAVYSAFKGNQFVTLDGTSMATPHVAGAAALFLETNPQLTARELWRSLVDGARSLGSTADFGSGELQVP
jgi:subtilisin family serine protease